MAEPVVIPNAHDQVPIDPVPVDDLVESINKILNYGGIQASVETLEVFKRNASSLLVAAFEALFQQRLVGIVRAPRSREDYVHNASVFLGTLRRGVLRVDFSGVNAEHIVEGDEDGLGFLCAVLLQLIDLFEEKRKKLGLDHPATEAAARPEAGAEPLDSMGEEDRPPLPPQSRDAGNAQPDRDSGSSENEDAFVNPPHVTKVTGRTPRNPVVGAPQRPQSAKPSQRTVRKQTSKKKRTSKRRIPSERSFRPNPSLGHSVTMRRPNTAHAIRRRKNMTKDVKTRMVNRTRTLKRSVGSVTNRHNYPTQVKKQLKVTRRQAKLEHNRRCASMMKELDKKDRAKVQNLLEMDAEIKRNLLSNQMKAANKEEVAINNVYKMTQKMERKYLADIRKLFNGKIQKLEQELSQRTDSIQNYFRDQYSMLQEELERQKEKNKIQNAATKKLASQVRQEMKGARKARMAEIKNIMAQMEDEDEETTMSRLSELINKTL